MTATIYWYSDTDGENNRLQAELFSCVVAEIRHCAEGGAEGGLLAAARFLVGALCPDLPQPPPSPAGWYWSATRTRGVWTPPARAETLAAAKAACEDALREYATSEGCKITHVVGAGCEGWKHPRAEHR